MRTTTYILTILITMICTTNAVAAIVATSGAVHKLSTPPTSVKPEARVSDTEIIVFDELQQFTLCRDLEVDITASGTYAVDEKELTPGVIPAGTVVSSHFLHFDQVGATSTTLAGSFTFSEKVLGIIVSNTVLHPNLDESDLILGDPSVTYPSSHIDLRGLEVTTVDLLSLSPGRWKVRVVLTVSTVFDQIRVITQPEPPFDGQTEVKFQQLSDLDSGHDEESTAYAVAWDPCNPTKPIGYEGRFIADDFADYFDTPIVALTWWGSYVEGQRHGGVERFLIGFESGSTPSSSRGDMFQIVDLTTSGTPGAGQFTETDTLSAEPLDGTIYKYSAKLRRPFEQDPNTVYWLKIVALVNGNDVNKPVWGWHIRNYRVEDLFAAKAPDVIPGEHVDGICGVTNVWHFQNAATSGNLHLTLDPDVPGCFDVEQTGYNSEFYWPSIDSDYACIGNYEMDLSFELFTWDSSTVYYLVGDFNGDLMVNFADLRVFCLAWLHSNCQPPDWCARRDINRDGAVGLEDFATFADLWLVE